MRARPLRLALAGAGLIGREHVLRIQAARPDCDLVALVDPAPALATVAQAGPGVPVHADLESMLREQRPDGVILATPNSLHVSGAIVCLRAGVPVLVEKPVATSLDEALELVRAQRATGVPALVGHHRRHSTYMATAKALIDSGGLGDLVVVNATTLFHKPDRYFTDAPWRAQPGGGPILINLVHDIDCLRMLAGDIAQAQAFSSNGRRGLAVEDTAAISMRFVNGALGTVVVSDTAAAPNSWEQTTGEDRAYARYPSESCYLIAGTLGSLALPTMLYFGFDGERSWNVTMSERQLPAPPIDPLAAQLAHFCDVVRGLAAPKVSVLDAAKTLQVVQLVAQAARTGERQTVMPWTDD